MTVSIHVLKEKSMQLYDIDEPYHDEEATFRRSRGSHMEIDPIDPIDPVDPVAPADDSQRHGSRPGEAYMSSTDSAKGRGTCSSS